MNIDYTSKKTKYEINALGVKLWEAKDVIREHFGKDCTAYGDISKILNALDFEMAKFTCEDD